MSLKQQPAFLICVPVTCSASSASQIVREIEEELDELGNPAKHDVQKALGASGVIHFLSLSVVWDENGVDRPILVADIAGDGTPKSIIADLVQSAGAHLLPAYRIACGVSGVAALQAVLERNWSNPTEAAFPFSQRRITGLSFQGTPGRTVTQILEDEGIAEKARSTVLGLRPRGPMTALSYVTAARQATGLHPLWGVKFDPTEMAPGIAITARFQQVANMIGLLVLDWSFLLLLLFAILYVNIEYIMDSIVSSDRADPLDMWLSIGFAVVIGIIVHSVIRACIIFTRVGKYQQINSTAFIFSSLITLFVTVMAFQSVPFILHDMDTPPFGWSFLYSPILRWLTFPVAEWMSIVLGFLALVLFLLLVAGLFLLVLRRHEANDQPSDADPDLARLDAILRREDRSPQNHMIGVSTIRYGFFRRFVTLPLGLYAVGLLVRAGIFRKGFLSKVGSIHFAQWACIPSWSMSAPRAIPKVRKLVFVADYDGSWQSYLEDFITLSPGGATAIWSNTLGFPRTRFLAMDGAADGDRFKRWGRRQMIPTRFWYSAYPHLTSAIIRENAAIRSGLEAQALTARQAEAWLKLFGSAVCPVNEIEVDEIQGLTLCNYRNLVEGALLAVTFPTNPVICRSWLSNVTSRIHFSDMEQPESAMAVALSARGLERLRLDGSDPLAAQFSPAFRLGMANESKARVLGDIGKNAPDHWAWGGPHDPVDAVLLIYAADRHTLRSKLAREEADCKAAGLKSERKINFHRRPKTGPIKEAFAFVDGISQPLIRGLKSSFGAPARDQLEPGEFILGYLDGRKQFPPTPQVFAYDDPAKLLPDMPSGFPLQPNGWSVRDLGRNGSYLVIRQLDQDVVKYQNYVNAAAAKLGVSPDRVGAKMVGRWPNGAPIVLFPHSQPRKYDPLSKDEEFLFGRDDPQGLACPFGAHIRRANPRDQFDPDDRQQMSISNRHRIIRRGRSYVGSDNSRAYPQGLVFMCLNADIERQFEFLQQTWVGSSSFGPLRDELDPLTAMNRTNGNYTIPASEGPMQLTGMPSFVSMIGGGYFFLPSRQALAYLTH
jgi:deferrochelatase/peroxidase EfeB